MTIAHAQSSTSRQWQKTPPTLQNGDRLSLAEFKHLYANSPKIRRAELIEGVVHVPSPVYLPHAATQRAIIGLLFSYEAATSGVTSTGELSVELDNDNEVQPDAVMWKNATANMPDDGPFIGSPQLMVEVAVSTRSYDLSVKKRVYRRNKVQEYLVLAAHEQEVHWFSWEDGVYRDLAADEMGIYRSLVFPGLWLNAAALWDGDMAALLATLNEGVNSAEHQAFVEGISAE